jgi:hypothetical protein
MNKSEQLVRRNRRLARLRWGSAVTKAVLEALRGYSEQFRFSVATGDLLLLDNGWYVTNAGLTRLARRNRCAGINVKPVQAFCDPTGQRWAFEATVYKSQGCRGFVGFGDADPSNVSPLVRGTEMRVAETRAVNRALRKAYGIGLCSIEEIGFFPRVAEPSSELKKLPPQLTNGSGNGSLRVRDRLCQLIRQHSLDPEFVKSYATDFCGAKTLKDATRAQVENFVEHLADWAEKDRNALLCQLNSYLPRGENKEGAA